jgi:hypothetical protein
MTSIPKGNEDRSRLASVSEMYPMEFPACENETGVSLAGKLCPYGLSLHPSLAFCFE